MTATFSNSILSAPTCGRLLVGERAMQCFPPSEIWDLIKLTGSGEMNPHVDMLDAS